MPATSLSTARSARQWVSPMARRRRWTLERRSGWFLHPSVKRRMRRGAGACCAVGEHRRWTTSGRRRLSARMASRGCADRSVDRGMRSSVGPCEGNATRWMAASSSRFPVRQSRWRSRSRSTLEASGGCGGCAISTGMVDHHQEGPSGQRDDARASGRRRLRPPCVLGVVSRQGVRRHDRSASVDPQQTPPGPSPTACAPAWRGRRR